MTNNWINRQDGEILLVCDEFELHLEKGNNVMRSAFEAAIDYLKAKMNEPNLEGDKDK